MVQPCIFMLGKEKLIIKVIEMQYFTNTERLHKW